MKIVIWDEVPSTSLDRKTDLRRGKLGILFSSDPLSVQDNEFSRRNSDASDESTKSCMHCSGQNSAAGDSSPYISMSPWIQPSPYVKSPWTQQLSITENEGTEMHTRKSCRYGLIGSLLREEGHIHSLAVSGDLLYTGSDSKNLRVWKGFHDFSGFKSSSGFVKAIVLYGDKIFTGHQDGKIRVWKFLEGRRRNKHKLVGNLPRTRDLFRKSINPKRAPWIIKHHDSVSCMSVDADHGLLYSGSWDKTVKVWRISDSKCLESIRAHDDAVNSVLVAFHGMVFTCSADGRVKAWRREVVGECTNHVLVETMFVQDQALTSLAFSRAAGTVYAGSSDGLVSFWEREKRFMSYGGVLRGHKLAVLCLAAGGNLVLSGSADQSICVWRREVGGTHSFMAVLTGHRGPVKCLAVQEEEAVADDEDKRWVVCSGSVDKSVKVWRVSELLNR